MIKINIYLRFALMAVLIIGGIVMSATMGFWYGFPFWLTGIGLLVGYFLLGTIQSAGEFMQANDFEAADKRLDLTFFPALLYPANRAYYYMIKGSIAQLRGDKNDAEKWVQKASTVKMPTDNDRAMVELQMANLAVQKGNWNMAKGHMRTLKALNVTIPQVKEQIAEFEKAMKQQGAAKNAMQYGGGRRGGMHRPGGKRRRPKMR